MYKRQPFTVQYNVVLLATLFVFTVKLPLVPSGILLGPLTEYEGAWSTTEMVFDATTVPEVLPVRILRVKFSVPSIVASSFAVMEKDPVLLLIVKLPETALKSAVVALIVQ